MTTRNIRTRFTAEFDYPGMLFPETITKTIAAGTLAAALREQPDEQGYFNRNGWYAVTIRSVAEKRYVADDDEETWVRLSAEKVASYVVGEKIHHADIEDNDRNAILISNIRANSKDGYGVRTRAGNWQIASDYDAVVSAEAAVAR